jgi:outer membrane lipoprotein-sorting protein
MYALAYLILLLAASSGAQDNNDAKAFLRKAESQARSLKSWRAEIVETSQLSGNGMNLQSHIRTKIAVQAPLKMRRENSGDDQTILVCDGADSFYMGDGHNYYHDRNSADVNQDCEFPLRALYRLPEGPVSISFVEHDQAALTDGSRACDVFRAEWKGGVRTMCIDPTSGLILRDFRDITKNGLHSVMTTTFTSYESNATFPPDFFKFSIPPGAVEAKPPI